MVMYKIPFLTMVIFFGVLFEGCYAQKSYEYNNGGFFAFYQKAIFADDFKAAQTEYESKTGFSDKIKIFWKGILCGVLIVACGAGYYFFYKKREGNGFFISKKKSLVTITPKESDAGAHFELHKEPDKDVLFENNRESTVTVHVETHQASSLSTFSEMYADILLVENNLIYADEMRSILKDVQATALFWCDNYDSETMQLDTCYACVLCP